MQTFEGLYTMLVSPIPRLDQIDGENRFENSFI